MRYFHYTDFGFPDAYAIVVNGNEKWLAEHPEQARKFVQALQRGYQVAADDPDRGAKALIDANPGVFSDEELVVESQRMLAADYIRTHPAGSELRRGSSGPGTRDSCTNTDCSPAPTANH